MDSTEESQLRSIHNRERSYVQFKNTTNYNVEVYWIDYRGQTVSYGILPRLASLNIDTFVTHPWIFIEQETKDRFMVGGKNVFLPQPWTGHYRIRPMNPPFLNPERDHIFITLPIYSLRDISLRVIKRLLRDDVHAFKLDIPLSLQLELASMLPRKSIEANP